MASKRSFTGEDGNANNFSKHLIETQRAFELMSLKNNNLDDQIAKLRKELEDKDEEFQDAYKCLLSMDEETEAERTILLSLRKTVRVEAEKGEVLKRKIEDGNQLLDTWQNKEREIIEKFEQDGMTIIEKARENHHINSTQELSGRVNTVRQQVKESQEKKRELEEKVAALKVQLYETQNNSGWEGLDQVYFQLK
ncbi:kinesin-like protein KIF16B [Diaphorina citri]|uniref:Kinesin-like protein KIF16B n=1 Tax=Diaphorina citri TaxID=121845 RepID=A0A3Q0IXA8_DIACI|nr:kinesin-like protein KIF16B [Diaphorina citri]